MSQRSYLIEETLKNGLGKLSLDGALVVETGTKTGRSTAERYIAARPEVESEVN